MAVCETCSTPLPVYSFGRPRTYCPPVNGIHECRELNDAFERMERALAPVTSRLLDGPNEGERAGVVEAIERQTALFGVADVRAIRAHAITRDHRNLVEIRYRLFCLPGDEVPRPRYPKGHSRAGQFISRIAA